MKRLLKIFLIIVVVIVSLPVLALALLQTGPGRSFAENTISSLASSKAQNVALSGLKVGWGLDVDLAQARLSDSQGLWLEVEQAHLQWSPSALISGRIEIETIGARRVSVLRTPAQSKEEPEASSSSLIILPGNIQQITAPHVSLGPSVLGEQLDLAIDGAARLDRQPVALNTNLLVKRKGPVPGTISARIAFSPDADTLAVDMRVAEPAGGLVARLIEIDDLPAVDMNVTGEGPLSDWHADLAIALDSRRTVTGTAHLTQAQDGTRALIAKLDGSLQPLVPASLNALVSGITHLDLEAGLAADFYPRSGTLSLASETLAVSAKGNYAPDTKAIDLTAKARLDAGNGNMIALELPSRRIVTGPVSAELSATGILNQARWNAQINTARIMTPEANIHSARFELSGKSADLSPDVLASDFTLSGATKLTTPLLRLKNTDGETFTVKAQGRFSAPEKKLTLKTATATGPDFDASLSETLLTPQDVSTSGVISLADLGLFAPLAERPLGGRLESSFKGRFSPEKNTGSGEIEATTDDVRTGTAQADALLQGQNRLTASVSAKNADSFALDTFKLAGAHITAQGAADITKGELDARLEATLENLEQADPRLAGTVKMQASASGSVSQPDFNIDAQSERLSLSETDISGLRLVAKGTASPTAPQAHVTLNGRMKDAPLKIEADLVSKDGKAIADPLEIRIADNKASGRFVVHDLAQPQNTLDGNLTIDAPALDQLAPLLMTRLSGQLAGKVQATPATPTTAQLVALEVTASNIGAENIRLETANLNARAQAPFDLSDLTARLTLEKMRTGSTPIHQAELSISGIDGQTVQVTSNVALAPAPSRDGVQLAGNITQKASSNAFDIQLDTLKGFYRGTQASLKQPALLSYAQNEVVIKDFLLGLSGGTLQLGGSAGEKLDLTATLTQVPLELANAFAPGTGIAGTLSGSVKASGPASSPEANWQLTASRTSASVLREKGIAALDIKSEGRFRDQQIIQTTRVGGVEGLNLTATGPVRLSSPGSLAVTLKGAVPLSLARTALLRAGFQAKGSIDVNGQISGTLSKPAYRINARPQGVSLTELSTPLTLKNVSGTIDITDRGIVLSGLSTDLATGGKITGGGTISMEKGLPAILNIKAQNARYVDPDLVTARFEAALDITGPLASPVSAPLIKGTINLKSADVSIPQTLPGTLPSVAIRHLNAPKAVRRQLALSGNTGNSSPSGGSAASPRLQVNLSAPGRIFIRGRGLDTELFGSLRLVGSLKKPQAIGNFQMKRGHLELLNRRLGFARGLAGFEGSLTPTLDFLASTSVDSTQVNIAVTGKADDPQISFSSAPELPQDEVLALFLFGKNMSALSPGQIAQLPFAIATLTGGSDSGPLARIRKSLGLDQIDVEAGGSDGPKVGVGKYINENIYLGVEQSASNSKVKVDIDLNRGLKLRGEADSNGSSKAGIFFEKEY